MSSVRLDSFKPLEVFSAPGSVGPPKPGSMQIVYVGCELHAPPEHPAVHVLQDALAPDT